MSVAGGYPNFHLPVCSRECLHEYRWRETLSIMGKPYRIKSTSE
jgi:hypothetical protein